MDSDSEKTAAEMREIAHNSLLAERQNLRDQLAEMDDQRARLRWQSDALRHNLNRLRVKIDNFERDSLMYATSKEDLGFGTWHVINTSNSPFVLLNLSMDLQSCLNFLETYDDGAFSTTLAAVKDVSPREKLLRLKEDAQESNEFKRMDIGYQKKNDNDVTEDRKITIIYNPLSQKTVFPDLDE